MLGLAALVAGLMMGRADPAGPSTASPEIRILRLVPHAADLELAVRTSVATSNLVVQASPRLPATGWTALSSTPSGTDPAGAALLRVRRPSGPTSFYRVSSLVCGADLVPEIGLVTLVTEWPAGQPVTGHASLFLNNNGNAAVPGGQSLAWRIAARYEGGTPEIDLGSPETRLSRDLNPGRVEPVEFDFTLPPGLPPGRFRLVFAADSNDRVCERREDNNAVQDSEARQVTGGFADLAVQIHSVELAATLRAGDVGLLNVGIGNVGNTAAAGRIDLRVWASADQRPSADDLSLGVVTNLAVDLPAGRTTHYQLSAQFPVDTSSETYNLLVELRPDPAIGDTNPANNLAVAPTSYQVHREFNLEDFRLFDQPGAAWTYLGSSTTAWMTNATETNVVVGSVVIESRVQERPGAPAGSTRVQSRQGGQAVSWVDWVNDAEGTHSVGQMNLGPLGTFTFPISRLTVAPATFDPLTNPVARAVGPIQGFITGAFGGPPATFEFEGTARATFRILGFQDVTLQSGAAYPKALHFEYSQSVTGRLYLIVGGQRSPFGDFTRDQLQNAWAAHRQGIVKIEDQIAVGLGGRQLLEQSTFTELTRPDPALADAADAPDLNWYGSGAAAWKPDSTAPHEGRSCLRSGEVFPEQLSLVEVHLPTPGLLSFWWRISSKTDRWAFLSARLNGVESADLDGEVAWEHRTLDVPLADSVVVWAFSTLAVQVETDPTAVDAAWLDQVNFQPDTGPPIVRQEPGDVSTHPGAPLELRASVRGQWPIAFQWRKDGTDLPWATEAVLSLAQLTVADAGHYQLFASNALGTAFTRIASVTVQAGGTLGDALDAPALPWTNSSEPSWRVVTDVTHDGVDSARSVVAGSSRRSVLETTVTGPGTLRFWWKIEAPDPLALLRVSLDRTRVSEIDGSRAWAPVAVSVPAGTHAVKWTFWTDWDATAVENRAWIDEVTWTP